MWPNSDLKMMQKTVDDICKVLVPVVVIIGVIVVSVNCFVTKFSALLTESERETYIIFITAESFSQYAIDKDLTPTLCKMYNEGFQFENYYSPAWGVSTTDGEYANLTGLIPKSGVWSFSKSAENNVSFPFTLGFSLSKYS